MWIARFRKQVDLCGEFVAGTCEMGGRQVVFVHLQPMEQPGLTPRPTPVLYEPKLSGAFDDHFRLQGWEHTEQRAWVAQEGDCWLLPARRSN